MLLSPQQEGHIPCEQTCGSRSIHRRSLLRLPQMCSHGMCPSCCAGSNRKRFCLVGAEEEEVERLTVPFFVFFSLFGVWVVVNYLVVLNLKKRTTTTTPSCDFIFLGFCRTKIFRLLSPQTKEGHIPCEHNWGRRCIHRRYLPRLPQICSHGMCPSVVLGATEKYLSIVEAEEEEVARGVSDSFFFLVFFFWCVVCVN